MTESTSTASAAPPVTTAGSWHLDPDSTTIEFHTNAVFGIAKVKGTFRAVSGSVVVGDQGTVSGELVVDANSIDTRNKRRDKHLRSVEFFDVRAYPTFSFTASEVTPAADGTLTMTGALRIRDRSHPIDVVATSTSLSPDRVTVTAESTIDRSKWGMTWARMGAALVNRVVVVAQFVRS
jgi:polyisoprenoid-binding protein YceI